MPDSLAASPAWQAFAQAVHDTPLDGADLAIIEAAGLQVDFTTQRHSAALTAAGAALLAQQGFEPTRQALFDGAPVNWTENRAAWHTALRAANPPEAVSEAVTNERARVRAFVEDADTRGAYKHILHLGIGGSDWGPRMVIQALKSHAMTRTMRFASNVDGHAIDEALQGLDPKQTLIVIASKTFTTTEPLANAKIALDWLAAGGVADPLAQVAAVTANVDAARAYGVAPERIFSFWDWVGGRYSLWSSIGLAISLALGPDALDGLLAGAADMDEHFLTAPVEHNAPVQMALAGIANCSVLGYTSLALAPYDARLASVVPWAQQLEMESLGKTATHSGSAVDVPTSPAVWGMPGTDGQHTFFQWLHQHPVGAPVDFMLCLTPDHPYARNHTLLVANCLAQRAALMRGKPDAQNAAEARELTADDAAAAKLAPHRAHAGGRPSTLIVLPRLTAHTLGALLAMYEHKVFTQGVVWGINPFDQWGVEYGKQLAKNIIHELDDPKAQISAQDPSTQHWIEKLSA
ncbi:glucose-6-phosphate isomerase [Schauerella aestuarii]|uniref:glucose-6-phosphate isomerase n=1 Tax=Schauerella aestuarii TaxID=2511204 RepID=UPI00136BCFE1|nr:glucose-6-phosphate isomerase [Achromobacter aestuarii]MYZ42602.1 glucose-6-phosphate isomerase [Achromobacter aestuarii]